MMSIIVLVGVWGLIRIHRCALGKQETSSERPCPSPDSALQHWPASFDAEPHPALPVPPSQLPQHQPSGLSHGSRE